MIHQCVPPRGFLTFLIQHLGGRLCLNHELRLRQIASSGCQLASVIIADSCSGRNSRQSAPSSDSQSSSVDYATSRRIQLVAGSATARSNRSTAGWLAGSRSTAGRFTGSRSTAGRFTGSRSTAGRFTAVVATVAARSTEQIELWQSDLRQPEPAPLP